MAESGISAPAEGTLFIADKWLDQNGKNSHAFADVLLRKPDDAFETKNIPVTGNRGRFEPRGLSINTVTNNGTCDDTIGFGYINRCLKNDPSPVRLRYAVGIIHSDRIRFLYAMGTTARGIAIRA